MKKLSAQYRKKRILLGPLDSGLNFDLKVALEKLGYRVTTLNFIEGDFQFRSDINLEINRVSWFKAAVRIFGNFIRSRNYDIYHFRQGQSLLPWNIDLPILKFSGKKMVMNFDGDDLRLSYKFHKTQANTLFAQNRGETIFLRYKKIWRTFWIKLWTDQITVVTPDLLEFAPGAKLIYNLVPTSIQSKKNPENHHKKIIIMHAPTDRKIKGTKYLVKAVKRLKREKFPVELLIVEKQPHQDIGLFYRRADIVVDQLLMGALSVVSYEGMLYGKIVICYLRADLRQYYPKDLPIISADPDTIYSVLKKVLSNLDELVIIGRKSRQYVLRNYSPKIIAKKWQAIYESI
ncbi:MAG: hypothetical protein ABSE91_03535 [Patescibacteria group bacterium]|jgi:glycosyltransferase involved in cell wall biosynthesis